MSIKFSNTIIRTVLFSSSVFYASLSIADITPIDEERLADISAQSSLGLAALGGQLLFQELEEQVSQKQDSEEVALLEETLKHGMELQLASEASLQAIQSISMSAPIATGVAVELPLVSGVTLATGFSLFGLPLAL